MMLVKFLEKKKESVLAFSTDGHKLGLPPHSERIRPAHVFLSPGRYCGLRGGNSHQDVVGNDAIPPSGSR